MLDVQMIRGDLDLVAARLATRGVAIDVGVFRALAEQRKLSQVRTQELQSRRNAASKEIGDSLFIFNNEDTHTVPILQ